MCLGIPAKVVERDGERATVDVAGARRTASLMLLPDAEVGEYVIVHAGFAIERIDPERAEETLELMESYADKKKTGDKG